MILKAIGDGAGVRTWIDFKAVRNTVVVKDVVQLAGVDAVDSETDCDDRPRFSTEPGLRLRLYRHDRH